MKKIGVLLTGSPGGGTFQYTQALLDAALALPPTEYSVIAAYADPVWLAQLPGGVSVRQLPGGLWNRILNRVWHESRLGVGVWRRTAAYLDTDVRALMAENCDLWICPSHDRFAFRAPVRTLGTVHDLMHRYEPTFPEVSEGGEFERREFHFGETCRWSAGVLVDSGTGKAQLQESYGIEPERVFVLPYIAPSYFYEPPAQSGRTVSERYTLPEKYFFYPAQFYPHKNHGPLLAAFARLRDSHSEAQLVLVGNPERSGYLQAMERVRSLDLDQNVRVLGYVPDADMPALYRCARALVMPTFFGPTNIPQLEAFACGCPVATSRIYGIPEQVGDAALLFDPGSVDEIHSAMKRLWVDDALCSDLAERGREHSRRWGPVQFRQRFETIVRELTA